MVAHNTSRQRNANERPTTYFKCPHCGHPAILKATIEEMNFRCRQCSTRYILRFPGERGQVDETSRTSTAPTP